MNTYTHTYIHTFTLINPEIIRYNINDMTNIIYVRTYVHTDTHTYVRMDIQTYVQTYVVGMYVCV